MKAVVISRENGDDLGVYDSVEEAIADVERFLVDHPEEVDIAVRRLWNGRLWGPWIEFSSNTETP